MDIVLKHSGLGYQYRLKEASKKTLSQGKQEDIFWLTSDTELLLLFFYFFYFLSLLNNVDDGRKRKKKVKMFKRWTAGGGWNTTETGQKPVKFFFPSLLHLSLSLSSCLHLLIRHVTPPLHNLLRENEGIERVCDGCF